MFVYTQDQWVMDIANYDMSGNTGWSEIVGDADNYNVRDERGLPHYKLVGGQLVEDPSYPEPEPQTYVTELERLDAIEAVILELMEE